MEYICSDYTATTQLVDHLLLYCTANGKPEELPPLAQFRYIFHQLAIADEEPDLWEDTDAIANRLETLRYIARNREMGEALSVAGLKTDIIQPSEELINLVRNNLSYERELRSFVALVKKHLPEPMVLNNLRLTLLHAVGGAPLDAIAAPAAAAGYLPAMLSPGAMATAARISSPLAQGHHENHPPTHQQQRRHPGYGSPSAHLLVHNALLEETRRTFREKAGPSTVDEALVAAKTIQVLKGDKVQWEQQPQRKKRAQMVEEEEEEEEKEEEEAPEYYDEDDEEEEKRKRQQAQKRAKTTKRQPTAAFADKLEPVKKTPRPPSKAAAAKGTPRRRERKRFSEAEDNALTMGVKQYGLGMWRTIIDENKAIWAKDADGECLRTNVDLKDRWRNLQKRSAGA